MFASHNQLHMVFPDIVNLVQYCTFNAKSGLWTHSSHWSHWCDELSQLVTHFFCYNMGL